MAITIRRATTDEADLESLAGLNLAVQQMHVDQEPEVFRQPTIDEVTEWFRGVLGEDGGYDAVLAFDGDEPVGYVLFELSDRPESTFTQAAKVLYIHQIGVAPRARRRGVGRSLLEAVRQEGAGAGAVRMGLDTWSFNEVALGFFEACGFEIFNVRLRRDVQAPIDAGPGSLGSPSDGLS